VATGSRDRIKSLPPACAAVLFTCLCLTGCVNDEKKVNELFERRIGVDQASDIVSYMSQGGRMKARLTSPRMLRFQDTLPRMEFPDGLHVDFYDTTLRVENQVDARYAKYLEMQNKVLLKDSVRVYNRLGDTLFCQELWWDQAAQRFDTDKPVRVSRPGMVINGVGLTAPQDFKTFTIFRITNSTIVNEGNLLLDSSTTLPPDTTRQTGSVR
jgi:LPS export ABC transporter protein LptC